MGIYGDSSEETLTYMYYLAGTIFVSLVLLGIVGYGLFREWRSLAIPSYTTIETDEKIGEQIQDHESTIVSRV